MKDETTNINERWVTKTAREVQEFVNDEALHTPNIKNYCVVCGARTRGDWKGYQTSGNWCTACSGLADKVVHGLITPEDADKDILTRRKTII